MSLEASLQVNLKFDMPDCLLSIDYTPTFLESDETNPAEPFFIDAGISSQNLADSNDTGLANIRAAALRRGEHLCMALNDSAYEGMGGSAGARGKKVFRHKSNLTGKNFPLSKSRTRWHISSTGRVQ